MIPDGERKILDLVEHPVFILAPGADRQPRYVAFNRVGLNLLGKPLADVLGRTAREVYAGERGEVAYRHHCETLLSGEPRIYDFVLPLETGQHRVQTTLTPERDSDDTVTRIIGVSHAETTPIPTEPEDRDRAADLQDLEDLVALAAHDLRSPILRVKSISNALRDELTDRAPDLLELSGLLDTVCDSTLTLIADVLSHAHTTGTARDIASFELPDLVASILKFLDPEGNFIWRADPVTLHGDRLATQVILRNMLDNAIKHARSHAPDGQGSTLELDISAANDAFGCFAITVADNGAGFSDPALLFLQGGRFEAGSGFGLLGVRRLIRARGGSLSVTNRPKSAGAVVTFSLPGTATTG